MNMYIVFCFCRTSSSTIKTHQGSDLAFRRSLQHGQKVSCKIHWRGHWLQQGHCPLLQRSRWGSPSCSLGFPKYHWCKFSQWLEHQRPKSSFGFEKEAWFHQRGFYRLDFLRTFRYFTLLFQNILTLKNKHILILPSSLSSYSSALKTKIIFQLLWCIFEGRTNRARPSQPFLKNCQNGTF